MESSGTALDWSDAVRSLHEADPVLAQIIDDIGDCTVTAENAPFRSLAKSIIHQQLSMKAARTILQRFIAVYPNRAFPEPSDLLCTPEETLRQSGLSSRKARYLKDLAQKFLEGTVEPSGFSSMSDEEIVQQLVTIKGVGRWTAEMFLIFCLARPNVLPVDDLGLQKAVRLRYGTADPKTALRCLAEKWHPHCTVATWYLWRSLDSPAII